MREYISEEEFVKLAQPLFKSIYKRNSGGCCLHSVIDDGNWDSLSYSEDLKHKDCRKLNELLVRLDLEIRERIDFNVKTSALTILPEEEDESEGEGWNGEEDEDDDDEETQEESHLARVVRRRLGIQ